jgi:hypothetical protein
MGLVKLNQRLAEPSLQEYFSGIMLCDMLFGCLLLLLQELSEYMGLVKLNQRLAEPSLQEYFSGIFPSDSMANMRFSINFFTSIGLGGITDRQRELYKQVRWEGSVLGTGV